MCMKGWALDRCSHLLRAAEKGSCETRSPKRSASRSSLWSTRRKMPTCSIPRSQLTTTSYRGSLASSVHQHTAQAGQSRRSALKRQHGGKPVALESWRTLMWISSQAGRRCREACQWPASRLKDWRRFQRCFAQKGEPSELLTIHRRDRVGGFTEAILNAIFYSL